MKVSSLIGPAAVSLLLLAACGGTTAPASTAPPSTAPAAAPSSAAAKPASAAAASASAKPAASAAASAKPAASAAASASVAPTATTLPAVAADTTTVQLTKTSFPAIQGKGLAGDLMEADQAGHMLYVSDRNAGGLDIWDISSATPKYVKTVATPSDVAGVTVANNVNKVFAGTGDGNVIVVDINKSSPTYQTITAKVDMGAKNANELDYDPNTKKIFIEAKFSGFLDIIDATNNQILKKIDGLGNEKKGLEQPRYNPVDKMMYMTAPETNNVFQFDPANNSLVKKWDIGDDCGPQGIGLNPNTDQALLDCSSDAKQHSALWDFKTGKVVATIDNTGRGDQLIYSPKADVYLGANSNFYRGPVIGIVSGSGKFITNVPSPAGAHQVAYDETNKIVYTTDRSPNGGLVSFPLPNK